MLHGGTLTNPPSKAGIEGFAKGLSQIASVANTTARNALASSTTGISATNPLWVYRRDIAAMESYDGIRWRRWRSDSYSGSEANPFGSSPAAGTPMEVREWIATVDTFGGGGGVIYSYPLTFAGVTSIQYSCLRRATRLSFWAWDLSSLFLTATDLGGSFLANGTSVQASIRVVGWV